MKTTGTCGHFEKTIYFLCTEDAGTGSCIELGCWTTQAAEPREKQ